MCVNSKPCRAQRPSLSASPKPIDGIGDSDVQPVYLELGKDRIVRLGAAPITGNRTTELKVPLSGLKERPKRAMLSYFNDVLCAP